MGAVFFHPVDRPSIADTAAPTPKGNSADFGTPPPLTSGPLSWHLVVAPAPGPALFFHRLWGADQAWHDLGKSSVAQVLIFGGVSMSPWRGQYLLTMLVGCQGIR